MQGVDLSILADWANTSTQFGMFYLLSFIAISLAFGVVMGRKIIRCGFLLIGVFCAISGIFLLQSAQFIAMAQIMIYAVGLSLVVVIALMLTNPRMEEDLSPAISLHTLPAMLVAVFAFCVTYLALRSEPWPEGPKEMPTNTIEQIGTQLLTYYSFPFEFASILLLVALIGAIMLAKAERREPTKSEATLDAAEELATERNENAVQV